MTSQIEALILQEKESLMDFIVTEDGSTTLYQPEVGEHYHSTHGAVQESRHVFLKSGLEFYRTQHADEAVSILEVGFGTGLNFLLTAEYAVKNAVGLDYCGIEAYPLSASLIFQSGYDGYVTAEVWSAFKEHYAAALEEETCFLEHIQLSIAHTPLLNFQSDRLFDVVYFDAFAAARQPEMWTDEALAHTCSFLKPGGVFVTYAITGNLKRSMKALGFTIEKAPGAPGKREMLRAVKLG